MPKRFIPAKRPPAGRGRPSGLLEQSVCLQITNPPCRGDEADDKSVDEYCRYERINASVHDQVMYPSYCRVWRAVTKPLCPYVLQEVRGPILSQLAEAARRLGEEP